MGIHGNYPFSAQWTMNSPLGNHSRTFQWTKKNTQKQYVLLAGLIYYSIYSILSPDIPKSKPTIRNILTDIDIQQKKIDFVKQNSKIKPYLPKAV